MNIKKTLLLALPLLGVAVGGLVAFNSKSASVAEAADYSTPNRSLSVDENGNVSANFTVTNEDFDLNHGWLLCLFRNKPAYDTSTRKLVGSADLHPYSLEACEHYFFAASSEDSGEIIINWESTLADQKEAWSKTKAEGAEGHQLKDYFDAEDWHIIIGPRHLEEWSGTEIGEGFDNIWENCDYYVGQKSALLNGVDGQTYLDLTEFTSWENDGDKFAFYYWDEEGKEGWSEFATSTSFDNIYVAQYSLGFVPAGMKAVRISSNAAVPSWEVKHNEGKDELFEEHGVIGITDWDSSSWSYAMASVKFSATHKVALDHLKRNSAGNSENFNLGFPLLANQEFDIDFKNVTYSNFEIHSSLTSNFDTTSVSGKVKVLVGGIYALYFNTDTHSLYITTVALAEADEWAQTFLGENCSQTKSNWSSLDYSYDKLSDEVKTIFQDEEHVAHDAEVTGHVALAVQRYDFLVENFKGYNDFMNRSSYQSIQPYESIGFMDVENSSTIVIVICAASISALAFTTLLVIKKRKSIR